MQYNVISHAAKLYLTALEEVISLLMSYDCGATRKLLFVTYITDVISVGNQFSLQKLKENI